MTSDRRADELHPEARRVLDLFAEADVPPIHARGAIEATGSDSEGVPR